jgi:hypothetical protein
VSYHHPAGIRVFVIGLTRGINSKHQFKSITGRFKVTYVNKEQNGPEYASLNNRDVRSLGVWKVKNFPLLQPIYRNPSLHFKKMGLE